MTDIGKSELERARWNGTDSTFEGWIVGRYTKLSGKAMVVLEDDRGLNHIYPVSDRLEVAAEKARAEQAEAALAAGEDAQVKAVEALKDADAALRDIYRSSDGWLRARADAALTITDTALTQGDAT